MIRKRFSFKFFFTLSAVALCFALCTAPAHAYEAGAWTYDAYIKSQFGVFTEGKPFNEAKYGGSDDNMATARQQFRLNLNGQLSQKIGVTAEVLAAWEPDYPHDKGVGTYGHDTGHIVGEPPANYYSSFDWRELTIEYKPTYSHTIRFGRQIINWGEAISGRVVDQCNPVDSRYLLGFTNLEETYMPLWMFRGIHDFYNYNSTLEWIVAPIWQADRYEHSRRLVNSGGRSGDGENYGGPWYRFGANPEGRIEKYSGADMAVYLNNGQPARIYGPPFATGYHGTDLVGAPTTAPLNAGTTAALINAYSLGTGTAAYLKDSNILWTEFPSTDGARDSRYAYNYTDHNLKNSRWGLKSKHMLWGAEVGLSFYQGPDHAGVYHYKYRQELSGPLAYLIYEYEIPRYNTYGLFGNYQTAFGIFVFEGAFKPDRQYQKNLFGLPPGTGANADWVHEARLNNVVERDMVHTLLGVTREQNVPFLNKYNVFTIRAQWQAEWALEDLDGLVETTTYFTEPEQVNHEFMAMISTSYSYRKYNPSLTFVANPRGQLYSSAAFNWIPGGYNDRLSISVGYTNIWGANDYSTPTVLAAKNDLAVVTLQYNFY